MAELSCCSSVCEIALPINIVLTSLVNITVGILISFWIDYGTHYIGGVRCAPDIPYTGGTASTRTFDPRHDVGPNGCTGQSDASWRIPFALQIFPGLCLGIGMFFFPETPRWLMKQDRDEEAIATLAKLRRLPTDDPVLVAEYVEIRAEVIVEQQFIKDHYPKASPVQLQAYQVCFRV